MKSPTNKAKKPATETQTSKKAKAPKRVVVPKKPAPTAAETKRFLQALEDVDTFRKKYNQ